MEVTSFSDIPLENIKGLLIDLDDTLYSYKKVHPITLKACHQKFQDRVLVDYSEFESLYRNFRNEVTERLSPTGACRSRLLAFLSLFESLNLRAPHQLALEATELYWSQLINEATLDSGARAFLEQAKSKQIPICVVTDMQARIQIQKLEGLGIVDFVDFLVCSEETGEEKPSPKMFQLALTKLSLTPKDVIMVGDSLKKDIEGANACGIRSYLVDLS